MMAGAYKLVGYLDHIKREKVGGLRRIGAPAAIHTIPPALSCHAETLLATL